MLHALATRRYAIYCKNNKQNLHCWWWAKAQQTKQQEQNENVGKASQRKFLKQEWAQKNCFDVGFSVHLSNLKHLAMGSHFLKLSYFAFLRLKYKFGKLKKVEDYVLDLGVGGHWFWT